MSNEYINLWTWQKKGFDIIKSEIDHNKSSWINDFPKYSELCKELSERLAYKQFIWSFTDDKIWTGNEREEWILNVPSEYVRLICSITWDWILERSNNDKCNCVVPDRLCYLSRLRGISLSRTDFQNQFHRGWQDKTNEGLWDMLFVDKIADVCTHALILCPLKEGWIIKRPFL